MFWLFIVFFNFCLLILGQTDDFISEGNLTDTTNQPNASQTFQLELFPYKPVHPGQTRMPRKFFSKIHSGAAFLTGLKLGTVLSKKGFELGHGKIASTHSFQIFGKPVNSAMSLAYGDSPVLPLLDEGTVSENEGSKRTTLKKEEKNVVHLTVYENVDPDDVPKEEIDEKTKKGEEVDFDKKGDNLIMLYQENEPDVGDNFIQKHNKMVKEFNDSILKRTNSKF